MLFDPFNPLLKYLLVTSGNLGAINQVSHNLIVGLFLVSVDGFHFELYGIDFTVKTFDTSLPIEKDNPAPANHCQGSPPVKADRRERRSRRYRFGRGTGRYIGSYAWGSSSGGAGKSRAISE
jgi:hypothetical protein